MHSSLWQVTLELKHNDNLGLMIRGGREYGLGIYVTGVDPESLADECGVRPGDEILRANGISLANLTHDEVVALLQGSECLRMRIKSVNKVPHSAFGGNKGSKSSSNSTLASHWMAMQQQQQSQRTNYLGQAKDFDPDVE